MKALLLCQNLGVGGAEELVLGASTRLPAEGVETGVVAITRRGQVAGEIAQSGVPTFLAPGQPGPRDPRAFANLVNLLRREQPDVVHTFLLNACLYGRLAAFLAGVPTVLVAEQNVYQRKKWRHARLEQLLALKTFRIVACCQAVGHFYREQVGVPPTKVAVLYNAVRFSRELTRDDREPARAALGVPCDALVIGTLGRLTEQKGHEDLLDAVARLAPRFGKLSLIVAGDGPLRGRLEERARELGIAERVRFLGIRRDRDTLYAAMDIFALPSRWEGLSLALVEAMGAGRAVVATEVGGNPEVVSHAKTGLLVQPGNSSVLADALGTVLADAQLAESLGAAASVAARERFSIERHVKQLAALYRQGVAQQNGSRVSRTGVGR